MGEGRAGREWDVTFPGPGSEGTWREEMKYIERQRQAKAGEGKRRQKEPGGRGGKGERERERERKRERDRGRERGERLHFHLLECAKVQARHE